MATQRGKLFELAEAYNSYRKGNQKKEYKELPKRKRGEQEVKGKHFDEGHPISLSYRMDVYQESMQEAYGHQNPSAQLSFVDDAASEAFYVEPFEEQTEEVTFQDMTDEDVLDKIVKPEKEQENTSQESLQEKELPADDSSEPERDSNQKNETAESKVEDDTRAIKEVAPKEEKDMNSTKEEQAGEAPYTISDEEFAKDIGAILQGKKVYDEEQKKTISRDEVAHGSTEKPNQKDSPQRSSPKEDALDPSNSEHKIFEKISQSMRYANSYDLGAIAMEERFDQMEKEIEEEEVRRAASSPKNKPIEDAVVEESADGINKLKDTGGLQRKFSSDEPLGLHNGGRSVLQDQLLEGDLVLITSSQDPMALRQQSDQCVAGVYAGRGKLLSGMLKETTLPSVLDKSTVVVLRLSNMDVAKASQITATLTTENPNRAEGMIKVNSSNITVHPEVCNDATEKDTCRGFSGKINLGTPANDSFFCAQSIVMAYSQNQVKFVTDDLPDIPGTIKESTHNGSLKYFGHLTQ